MEKYFHKNVNIITKDNKDISIKYIYDKSFSKNFFIDASIKIANKINLLQKSEPSLYEKSWVTCSSECFTTIYKILREELESTAYMISCISNSYIGQEKCVFIFDGDITKITGKWKDDKNLFYLKNYNNDNKKSRLLMGFGPSSSGKTYIASSLIKLFSSLDDNFPTTFISIDGGIYRESSFVYKLIRDTAVEVGFAGILNLMDPHGTEKSIFETNNVKTEIFLFLVSCKENHGLKISLYVPETLGSCGNIEKPCSKSYNKYIDITNDDSWIGLLVYQHKYGGYIDCPYNEKFKCIGCTTSGRKREIVEGKKYNNKSWENAMKNGEIEIMKAKYKFKIHNSGKIDSRTIIEDLSDNTNMLIKESSLIKEINGIYSLKINKNFVYVKKSVMNGGSIDIDSKINKYKKKFAFNGSDIYLQKYLHYINLKESFDDHNN